MHSSPIQAPTGTRDFYPIELARRRWIEDKWRKTAIRHGFEEIDGPTFESTELYTRKSGEGIICEIFGTYSGKDEAGVKLMGQRLAAGETGAIAPYALRPEFTPTLARMFAARAGQLPKPTKWFWQQNCYRAEKPQRGRLREFMQWNVDVLGDVRASADVEVVACCVDLLSACGLSSDIVKVRFSHRGVISLLLSRAGIEPHLFPSWFDWIDQCKKFSGPEMIKKALAFGGTEKQAVDVSNMLAVIYEPERASRARADLIDKDRDDLVVQSTQEAAQAVATSGAPAIVQMNDFMQGCAEYGLAEWLTQDFTIVRGLAYYTGMVFEVIVDGERAVAGGGRYDNLIETFGGPPTPAVGFGMGDVVLSLVLQDKGLMPSDKQIATDLGLRPDAFVISNGTPESDAAVAPLLAQLRRQGLHARRSYKATGKIGKLLKEASDTHSRFAVIIESPTEITLKDMDNNTQDRGPTADLLTRIKPPHAM